MIPVLLGTMWQLLPPLYKEHTSVADVSHAIFRQPDTKEAGHAFNRAQHSFGIKWHSALTCCLKWRNKYAVVTQSRA